MDNILIQEKDNFKTIFLYGAIDSSNAEAVSNEVFAHIKSEDNVIFDFDKVTYISSAGLRIILKAVKSTKQCEVINVSNDVYEIFDMTGFNQIIKIKKALRVLSIEGKELIGQGYVGKIYRIDPDTIIKVYIRDTTYEDVLRESNLAKKAFVLGVPTAIPFDVVRVKEGGYGAVFELIKSECLNKLYIAHPENEDHYTDIYTKLLKTIMSTKVDDISSLPSKKLEPYKWINTIKDGKAIDERVADKLEKMVDEIPDEHYLVHGDCHVKNIMMQGDEPLLIDMDTLGYGNKLFEITAFYLTYIGYPAIDPNNSLDFLGIEDKVVKRIFKKVFNEIFIDKTDEEKSRIMDKLELFGHLWLLHKTIKYDISNTLRYNDSRARILKLIDKVDSFII